MQDRVTGAVSSCTSALCLTLTVIRRHAAEGTLIDLAFFCAGERHAPMFQLVNGFRRVAAEIFDTVLVTEPVGAFHRIIHMPAPIIRPHIAERCRNAALRCNRVRARGENFRDTGGTQASL